MFWYTIKIYEHTSPIYGVAYGFEEKCCKDSDWYTIVYYESSSTSKGCSLDQPTSVKRTSICVLWCNYYGHYDHYWFSSIQNRMPQRSSSVSSLLQWTECLLNMHPLVSDIPSSGLSMFVVMSPTIWIYLGYHVGSFWFIMGLYSSIPHFRTNIKQSHRSADITRIRRMGVNPPSATAVASFPHWAAEQEQPQIVVQLGVFSDPGWSRIQKSKRYQQENNRELLWSCSKPGHTKMAMLL